MRFTLFEVSIRFSFLCYFIQMSVCPNNHVSLYPVILLSNYPYVLQSIWIIVLMDMCPVILLDNWIIFIFNFQIIILNLRCNLIVFHMAFDDFEKLSRFLNENGVDSPEGESGEDIIPGEKKGDVDGKPAGRGRRPSGKAASAGVGKALEGKACELHVFLPPEMFLELKVFSILTKSSMSGIMKGCLKDGLVALRKEILKDGRFSQDDLALLKKVLGMLDCK